MARAWWCAVLGPIVVAVGLIPRADAADPNNNNNKPGGIRLGVLSGMFRGVPPEVIQAVAEPFRGLFVRQTGLDGDVEVVDDCETLAAKLKAKDVHIGVFHGFEWAWVKDRYPELQPLVVTKPSHQPIHACLVVNVKSKALGPPDLKGACVAVPEGSKAHCLLFHDRIRATVPAGVCEPSPTAGLVPEEVLDAVANGKCEAGLVDESSLAAYTTNKPGVAARLKVLTRSEAFPPAVVVYRKEALTEPVVGKIRDGLVQANKTAQGRTFMFLWKLKGFEDVPAGYEGQLEKVRKAYPAPTPPPATPR